MAAGTRWNPLGARPDFGTPLGRNSRLCWFNEIRNPAEPAPEPAYFEGRLGRNVHFRAAPDHQYILLIKDTGSRAEARTTRFAHDGTLPSRILEGAAWLPKVSVQLEGGWKGGLGR